MKAQYNLQQVHSTHSTFRPLHGLYCTERKNDKITIQKKLEFWQPNDRLTLCSFSGGNAT